MLGPRLVYGWAKSHKKCIRFGDMFQIKNCLLRLQKNMDHWHFKGALNWYAHIRWEKNDTKIWLFYRFTDLFADYCHFNGISDGMHILSGTQVYKIVLIVFSISLFQTAINHCYAHTGWNKNVRNYKKSYFFSIICLRTLGITVVLREPPMGMHISG